MNYKRLNIGVIIIILIGLIILISGLTLMIRKTEKREEIKEEKNETIEEFVQKLEDGTNLNTSTKMKEAKKIEGMIIDDIQLTEKNNVTLLLAKVTNETNSKQGGYPVKIEIMDKEGNEIISIEGYIGELESGESTQLSISASFNYANAYDFVISKK